MPLVDGVLTVGVTTRDRPDSLVRCVRSLALLGTLVREVVVVDDASRDPVEPALRGAPGEGGPPLRVVRHEESLGYIVARNALVAGAATEAVLLLDDDALVLDPEAVRRGVAVLLGDPQVAVVAFAQAEADGRPWPAGMQPSPVDYPCQVPSHVGFAHLVRRSTFRALGGYRESFHFYGEEKELALRLLDHGHRVVYLPDALVGHVPDAAGRSGSRYLRYTVRNNCLGTLYDEPLPLLAVSLPLRLLLYFRMRRAWGIDDPGGFRWIVHEVVAQLPAVLRERKAVRWRTLRRWRALRRAPAPYAPAEESA